MSDFSVLIQTQVGFRIQGLWHAYSELGLQKAFAHLIVKGMVIFTRTEKQASLPTSWVKVAKHCPKIFVWGSKNLESLKIKIEPEVLKKWPLVFSDFGNFTFPNILLQNQLTSPCFFYNVLLNHFCDMSTNLLFAVWMTFWSLVSKSVPLTQAEEIPS